MASEVIATRIDTDTLAQVDALAQNHRVRRSDIFRVALDTYLEAHMPEKGDPEAA
jgi:hypothetical protein